MTNRESVRGSDHAINVCVMPVIQKILKNDQMSQALLAAKALSRSRQ